MFVLIYIVFALLVGTVAVLGFFMFLIFMGAKVLYYTILVLAEIWHYLFSGSSGASPVQATDGNPCAYPGERQLPEGRGFDAD